VLVHFPGPNTKEETNYAVQYVRALKTVHGINAIYFGHDSFLRSTILAQTDSHREQAVRHEIAPKVFEKSLDFQRRMRQTMLLARCVETLKRVSERAEESRSSLEGNLAATAVEVNPRFDSQFALRWATWPFRLWCEAKQLGAVVVFASTSILAKSVIISPEELPLSIARDIKRWFFSHYADFEIELPVVRSFDSLDSMAQNGQDEISRFRKIRELLIRTRRSTPLGERAELLAAATRYESLMHRLGGGPRTKRLTEKSPIAMKNSHLVDFSPRLWNHQGLLSTFQLSYQQGRRFDPCFCVIPPVPEDIMRTYASGSIRYSDNRDTFFPVSEKSAFELDSLNSLREASRQFWPGKI